MMTCPLFRFPKTYPTLATPIFTVQQPILGLKPHHIAKISSIVHAEAQKLKGTEAVFQVSQSSDGVNRITPKSMFLPIWVCKGELLTLPMARCVASSSGISGSSGRSVENLFPDHHVVHFSPRVRTSAALFRMKRRKVHITDSLFYVGR